MKFSANVEKAVSYLTGVQRATGQFPFLCSFDDPMKSSIPENASVFGTAVIAHALLNVPEAAAIVQRSAAFLESEMHEGGVWKYWVKADPRSVPMPPDVDDTSFVAMVLRHLGRSVTDSEARVLAERDRLGRFRTWMGTRRRPIMRLIRRDPYDHFWKITEAEPDDIDAVVNANVIHFLGSRPETAGAVRWLANHPDVTAIPDKWYLDGPVHAWGLARVINLLGSSSPLAKSLRSYVIGELANSSAPAMFSAMLGEAAMSLDLDPAMTLACAKKVADGQMMDGSWSRHPFYYGGPKRKVIWSGETISTAICASFLARLARPPA